jgi:hypothetical protein
MSPERYHPQDVFGGLIAVLDLEELLLICGGGMFTERLWSIHFLNTQTMQLTNRWTFKKSRECSIARNATAKIGGCIIRSSKRA